MAGSTRRAQQSSACRAMTRLWRWPSHSAQPQRPDNWRCRSKRWPIGSALFGPAGRVLCRVLGVSVSGFHDYLRRQSAQPPTPMQHSVPSFGLSMRPASAAMDEIGGSESCGPGRAWSDVTHSAPRELADIFRALASTLSALESDRQRLGRDGDKARFTSAF